jgi:hypothetical protein
VAAEKIVTPAAESGDLRDPGTQMPDSNEQQQSGTRAVAVGRFRRRDFWFLTLGIVSSVVGTQVYRFTSDSPPPAPSDPRTQALPPESPPVIDEKAVRQEAWQRVQPHLQFADQETRKLTDQLIQRIHEFFDSRRERSRAFAEAAVSWKSKWELIKSREGHRKFLEQQFSEYIFTQEELAAVLQEATSEYAMGLKGLENQMLVRVRADLEDLPAAALPAFADGSAVEARFEVIVAAAAAAVVTDLKLDALQGITTFAAAEVVGVMALKTVQAIGVRLGFSGAILGVGAATSWATLGAGLAIAAVADYLVDVIIRWFHDPTENVARKVTAGLDDLKQSITLGDPQAWKLHDRILRMSQEESDPALRAKAETTLARIRQGGNLGLKYALSKVADVQNRSRESALQKLVLEGGQE